MKEIYWEVVCLSAPAVLRHCKKCGKKTEYISTNLFRVNAQKKYLDIWLIYRCIDCGTTWNMTVFSRINPKTLPQSLLFGFYENNLHLAQKYANDRELLEKNHVQLGQPRYQIDGEQVDFLEDTLLTIKCSAPFPIRLSTLMRKKMGLSQKTFQSLAEKGFIVETGGLDLNKCRLKKEHTIFLKSISSQNNIETKE